MTDEREGYLIQWLRMLQPGYVMKATDVPRIQRIIMALKMGDKHHRQARGDQHGAEG